MELFVDTSRPRGATRELYDQLRAAIVAGRVAHGERLPATRDLARQLGVSRHTVTTVYGRLVAEGYLVGRAGGGTYVSYEASPAPVSQHAGVRPRPFAGLQIAPPPAPDGVDLRMGRPDPRLFPLAEWRRCVVTALQTAPPGGSPPPGGYGDLRRAFARWVARSRGVDADPANVVVTAGAQHAVDLATRALLRPGDTVAVENPGYGVVRRLFESLGLRVVPVPLDAEGLVVDAIPAVARLVYVTPSHQSPSGVTMSLRRRQALLHCADQFDLAIIEDDYDSEFRHTARPLEPLFRLDRGGRVLYVGTFSKTMAPSLKVGFAAVPPTITAAIEALVDQTGSHPALLSQQALHRFVADGHLDRHLRRARRAYAERHAVVRAFVDELVRHGTVRVGPPSHAGLHVTVRLGEGRTADDVIERARAAGVALTSIADSWAGPPEYQALVIGFGRADPAELERGLQVVRTVLTQT
jgi:GntR family transcriptional regulator/MocR family aminotransferase